MRSPKPGQCEYSDIGGSAITICHHYIGHNYILHNQDNATTTTKTSCDARKQVYDTECGTTDAKMLWVETKAAAPTELEEVGIVGARN